MSFNTSITWLCSLSAKLQKVERRTKQTRLFFLPRRSKFATLSQSYEKNERRHTLMEEKHIPLIWWIWLLHIEIFGIYKTYSFENLGVFLWKIFEIFGIFLLFSFDTRDRYSVTWQMRWDLEKQFWRISPMGDDEPVPLSPHFASLIRVVKENAVPIIHWENQK